MKRKITIILLTVLMSSLSAGSVFADSGKECLALGADLSDSEKETVLELLDISEENEYGGAEVITVTNDDEHKYLDSYIDSSEIGSRALSSVLIREKSSDNTISVETHNITYCTEGMYRNALATAGVKGADVVVAGPFDISGTAALVGTIKAYEALSGEEVDDDVIESSVEEVLTTGDIGEDIGDTEKAEAIIASVKEELADDPDMSDEDIRNIILEASEKAGVELTDEQIDTIVNMLKRMKDSGVDWDNIKEQSASIMESFKDFVSSDETKNAFEKFFNWISDIFSGIMGK